jgi:MFS family permease
MGAGALIGAVLRPRISRRFEGSWVPYTITSFGLSGILLGLAPNLWVAGVAMMLAGLFWLLTLATLNATAQLMSPAWIRGRAMSIYTLAFAGVLPIGSIASGLVADQIGTTGSLVGFSSGAVILGLLSPRFRIPHVDEVVSPEFSEGRVSTAHDGGIFEGGPVIVLNTWKIAEPDFAEFTNVMNEVRLVRLSTGAYRWRLFRSTSDPTRLTELMALQSWEDHLAQHARIDDGAAALLRRARSYDTDGGPRTRHLVAIDVEDPPDFDRLVVTHEALHQTDGSIPDADPGS